MSEPNTPRVLVLGAAGLIGHFVAADLVRRGFSVVAAARRFTPAQRHGFGKNAREVPIVDVGSEQLSKLLEESRPDVVFNCIGLLQDVTIDEMRSVHVTFVEKLLRAMRAVVPRALLIHVSIPDSAGEDATDFSRSKRLAERQIMESGHPYAILRPGFVWAPAAFGGSALMRALAALPVSLPVNESDRPFSVVAVEDIAETAVWLSRDGRRDRAVTWDLTEPQQRTVGEVIGELRRWLGMQTRICFTVPRLFLDMAAKLGDLAAYLGWKPPVRSTALAELRRGVEGNPRPWMNSTGIKPRSFKEALRERPATIQDQWFARLYGLKALTIASLVAFWCLSGLIALAFAYDPAVAILTSYGFHTYAAHAITIASSILDIAIGLAIAVRRTCRLGLMAGIAVSVGYMVGAAFITPALWIEPLGALVKTGPAIVLMLVALAIMDDR